MKKKDSIDRLREESVRLTESIEQFDIVKIEAEYNHIKDGEIGLVEKVLFGNDHILEVSFFNKEGNSIPVPRCYLSLYTKT